MHRFYLPPAACSDSELTLTGREAHHGLHVLRLQPGETVGVLDGVGHEYLCETRDMRAGAMRLTVTRKNAVPRLPYELTLMQAVVKRKLFEAIVHQATELGVSRIVPLLSERVIPHGDGDDWSSKLERWCLVAIEAIKQCGSAWLPRIEPPVSVESCLARGERPEMSLIASLLGDGQPPRAWLGEFFQEHARPPQSVSVWVGPEGDFTAAEVQAVRSSGARPITLGRHVLRSETAATYCLSVLSYELEHAYR